jgi:hypothetical protein
MNKQNHDVKSHLNSCSLLFAGMMLALSACGEDMASNMLGDGTDPGGPTRCQGPAFTENVSQCVPAATDYKPRSSSPVSATWPACVTNDNQYHLIGTSLPAAASRTSAFESIAARLWRKETPITTNDFLLSRNDYSVMEGIGSRVARRQDVHYAELPGDDKFACANEGVPAQYPDRCAGPAKVKPIVDDAFAKGLMGVHMRVQAARLEASLLWFFYLSTVSEVWTCSFDDIADCDSAWGYFNGSQARSTPIGLGGYIKSLGQETYDRGFDGILAERCWRDLDQAMPATDNTRYQLSRDQLDKAELRGLALILRDRFGQIGCSAGEIRDAHMAFVGVLGPFLDRAARAIDPAKADALKAQYTAATPAQVDVAQAQQLLDQLFSCP